MAFTKYNFGPHRWQHFDFFASGSAVGSCINESVEIDSHNGPWKLQEIRLHFSDVMGSVKYMTVKVSSILDSVYDAILVSQDLNGVQDYR